MSYSRSITALLLAFTALVCADDISGPNCEVSATVTARSGAHWIAGSTYNQIYDLSISNIGSCPADNVGLNINVGSSASVAESWNLMADSRYYLLQGFGPSGIAAQGSFNGAGFVVTSPDAASNSATVTVYGSACPRSCVNANSTTTVPPTPAPTAEPTTPPAPAYATATVQRDTTSAPWTDANGNTVAVYRLVLVNNANVSLTDFVFSLGFLPFHENITVESVWNLEGTLGGYQVTGYGPSLAAGATYTGSGFTIANVGDSAIQVDVYGANYSS